MIIKKPNWLGGVALDACRICGRGRLTGRMGENVILPAPCAFGDLYSVDWRPRGLQSHWCAVRMWTAGT